MHCSRGRLALENLRYKFSSFKGRVSNIFILVLSYHLDFGGFCADVGKALWAEGGREGKYSGVHGGANRNQTWHHLVIGRTS